MASYLDKTGLTTLWSKVKSYAAPMSHTHEVIVHQGGGQPRSIYELDSYNLGQI